MKPVPKQRLEGVAAATESSELGTTSGGSTPSSPLAKTPQDDPVSLPTHSDFRGDPRRYLVLLAFLFHNATNAMQWITYSPIVEEVKSFYQVDSGVVDELSSVYMFGYTAFVFVSCKAYEVLGLKHGLAFAAVCNTIGAATKLITVYGPPDVRLLFLSQSFNCLTQIFLIATPPLVATTWFLGNERTLATTLMTCALNLGVAFGMLLPTWFVGPGRSAASDFASLYWVELALTAVPLVGTLVFTPLAPRTPPSRAAQRQSDSRLSALSAASAPARDHGRESTWCHVVASSLRLCSTVSDSLKLLRSDRSFALLNVTCGVQVGIIWAVATVLAQVVGPFGISESDAAWMGFCNLSVGTLGAVFVGRYVDRNKRFKETLLALMFGLVLSLAALLATLTFTAPSPTSHRGLYTWCVVLYSVAGICQNATLPLLFEFAVELTFPHPEAISASLLTWNASWMALVFLAGYNAILGDSPDRRAATWVLASTLLLCTCAAVAMLAVKSNLGRQQYERIANAVAED